MKLFWAPLLVISVFHSSTLWANCSDINWTRRLQSFLTPKQELIVGGVDCFAKYSKNGERLFAKKAHSGFFALAAVGADADHEYVGLNERIGKEDTFVVLKRLQSDGEVDPTFGEGGLVRRYIGRFTEVKFDSSQMILGLDDGEVVQAASIFRATEFHHGTITKYEWELVLWKYDRLGRPVESFGKNGVARFRQSSLGEKNAALFPIEKMISGHDGKILIAAGRTLLQIHKEGHLDSSFNIQSIQNTFTGFSSQITDASVDSKGRIYLSGPTAFSTFSPQLVGFSRFKRDGEKDSTFGDSGIVWKSNQSTFRVISAVAYSPTTNEILVLDEEWNAKPGTPRNHFFHLRSFQTNGKPNDAFGIHGVTTFKWQPGSGTDMDGNIFLDKSGNIYVIGQGLPATKLAPNGSFLLQYE